MDFNSTTKGDSNPIPSFIRSTLALDVSFSKVNATLIAVAGLWEVIIFPSTTMGR
jgi:hypothetical protein